MDIPELVQSARQHLHAMTGLPLESTVEVRKGKNGAWSVSIELLEKKSIPDGQDLLATYQASLDAEGQVTGFKRRGMRKRAEAAEQLDEAV